MANILYVKVGILELIIKTIKDNDKIPYILHPAGSDQRRELLSTSVKN